MTVTCGYTAGVPTLADFCRQIGLTARYGRRSRILLELDGRSLPTPYRIADWAGTELTAERVLCCCFAEPVTALEDFLGADFQRAKRIVAETLRFLDNLTVSFPEPYVQPQLTLTLKEMDDAVLFVKQRDNYEKAYRELVGGHCI